MNANPIARDSIDHQPAARNLEPHKKLLLSRYVSDYELEQVIRSPTLHSESQTIDIWRRYIFQKGQPVSAGGEGALGQFQAMEKMISSYRDIPSFNSNRYYTEVWLKYVSEFDFEW